MSERRSAQGIGKRRKKTKGFTFYAFVILLIPTVAVALPVGSLFLYFSHNLPDYSSLKERREGSHSIIYSEDDEVIGKFLLENRIPVPFERIPKHLVHAFIAAEDAEFFRHGGVDYKGILRAMFKNLISGKIVQGGSTITQQVAKTFFLTPRKSLMRKLKEVAYAFGLERNLSKEEILSLYLNNVYLGNGAYGVEAAAESYFNKRVEQLNLAEAAMIAGLVKAPSRYSPVNNLRRAKERQNYVLTRMVEEGYITESQKDRALKTPLRIQSREGAFFSKAPYFTEFIRQQVEKKYGKEKVYQEGLRIYTTLDLSLQRMAQKAVDAGLRELDKRQGFRGPIRTLSSGELSALVRRKPSTTPLSTSSEMLEAVILSKDDAKKAYQIWVEDRRGILPYSEMLWALHVKTTSTFKPGKVKDPSDLLKPGDVVYVRLKDASRKDGTLVFTLDQEPLVQGALLCVDPRTGYVKAMVGGRDFSESQFNRVLHSRRQPGSAFKPLIYAAALEKGYTPSTILMDSPVEYSDHDGGSYWAPKNYDKSFKGPITFRNALAHSRNVVTVKILEDIGIGYALKFFKRMGIESPIERNLSVALGSSGLSMLELTSAFSVFANGGERVKPIFIRKIATMKGEVLEEDDPYRVAEEGEEDEEETPETVPPPPRKERVLSPQVAFLMTHLLEGVVQHGTGQGAKVLGRPVAGKTGTSSDYTDAWFVGYTPSLLAGVWVGFDDKTSLGKNETGARAALPIWVQFMASALKNTPVETFQPPEGIKMVKVNLETGLPTEGEGPGVIWEAFLESSPESGRSETERKEGEVPRSTGPGRSSPAEPRSQPAF